MDTNLSIVEMNHDQAKQAWLWAKEEKMIGSVTAVDYGGYGFIGMFVIHPEFRGKRYGKALFHHILKKMKELPNAGLDGVQAQVNRYKEMGFKPAYDIHRYKLPPSIFHPTKYAVDFNDANLEEIAKYDTNVFGVSRIEFLKGWLSSKYSNTAILRQNDKIVGYGVSRACYNGRKIGPLFADNAEIAKDILGFLLSKHKGCYHFIDVPTPVPNGSDLVKGAEIDFTCTRMYLGERPQQNVKKVYGNTTFEMG